MAQSVTHRHESFKDRSEHGSWGIVFIGIGKLSTGLLLAAAGFGIFHYLDRDLREVVEHFVALIRLDPDSRVVHLVLTQVSGIDRRQLRELGVGTFFYAVLHLVEGTGLILRKPWAECLTVVSTASLIPVEALLSRRRMSTERAFIILINVMIVIYLVVKLVQQHKMRVGARTPGMELSAGHDASAGSNPRHG